MSCAFFDSYPTRSLFYRNKEIKDKITSLGPVRREKFKLDSRILDLEKEIYEKNETYREEITALEDAYRKTKLVNTIVPSMKVKPYYIY